MLTERDCKMIANCFCDALKSDTELQDVMAKAMARQAKQKDRLIKLSDAAKLLGCSKSLLYQIQEHFSTIKTGNSKTSHILFHEARLIPEYEAYVARKRA